MASESKLSDQTGGELPGYLNASAGKGKPSAILIHEYWGVNSQIRGMADRLAKEGFVVFAPDLFQGKIATDAGNAQKLMEQLDWKQAVADVQRAADALLSRDPGVKVGVIGFCMGGAVALASAANNPKIKACVPFYGIPTGTDLSKIKAKIQGHYARKDEWCSPERVDALERTLNHAGVPAEIHRYDASHAFCNEKRPEVYSPKNAEVAWNRAVNFLRTELA